ncbi:MAG: hypothetical protein IRZ00_13175 [Gemmatimonadetes bacterium]|nr:hypothetical protein [Gemmatimonadota bacterium]
MVDVVEDVAVGERPGEEAAADAVGDVAAVAERAGDGVGEASVALRHCPVGEQGAKVDGGVASGAGFTR